MKTFTHGLFVVGLLIATLPVAGRDNDYQTRFEASMGLQPGWRVIRQAEQEALAEAIASPEVIELRTALTSAEGEKAKAISVRLQILRDAAAARGRAEGLRRLAAQKEADRQNEEMLRGISEVMAQAQRDQRIYEEAVRARTRGETYYVDPATAARIFGR